MSNANNSPKGPRKKTYPDRLRKSDCIYLEGVVTLNSRGNSKVILENDLECLCSYSKLKHRRITLLVGDEVLVEIPVLSLAPGEKLRGRIVYRF